MKRSKYHDYCNRASIVLLSAESAKRQNILDWRMLQGYLFHLKEIAEDAEKDPEVGDDMFFLNYHMEAYANKLVELFESEV